VNLLKADPDAETALRLVGLPALMSISAGVPAVSLALIDGPVALHHPDIAAESVHVLQAGGDQTCATSESSACTHGTYVAGILHARRDSLVRGICPGCTLLVRPIFSDTGTIPENSGVPNTTVEELTTAIYDAIEAGACVINLSVGLAGGAPRAEPSLNQALQQAARRGVIIVAAAGNQGSLGSSAITRHPWVIPVVGCDRDGHVLALSNLGASIGRHGLAGPGHNVTSLAASGGYAQFSGSSAAVPFVSGTIALLWSVFPDASASQICLAITGGLAGRRSVTPPLLNAWSAYLALAPSNARRRAL
jgi:subtilisin family serine protease